MTNWIMAGWSLVRVQSIYATNGHAGWRPLYAIPRGLVQFSVSSLLTAV
jgi:hypothetical protein